MIGQLQNDAVGKLTLRLTVGVLMLFHGIGKMLHPGSLEFIGGMLVAMGIPSFVAYGVYFGEVIAPLMIVFGIFARFGGLVLAANMVFAIALAHMGDLLSLGEHGGYRLELQFFYLFGALAVVFLGSGKIALRPD